VRALISLTVLSFALLGCGGPLLFAEVEEPDLCMTEPDVLIPGAAGIPSQTLTIRQDIVQDVGTDVPLIGLDQDETRVRLNEVTLTARTGGVDLNVFQAITLQVLPPLASPELPPLDLLRYERASTDPTSALTLRGADPVDLGPYMRGGQVRLRLEFVGLQLGDLPQNDWTADVKTCVYLKHKADYGRFIGL
jgi:hypothetical protein